MAGPYTIPEGANQLVNQVNPGYRAPEPFEGESHADATSWLGTPVWGAIMLKLSNSDAEPLVLLECVSRVRGNNELVRELPAGETGRRRGAVVEFSSQNDYSIAITGRLSINHNEQMPLDEIEVFVSKIFQPVVFEVESRFFNVLGITQMVVDDYEINEVAGIINTVDISINAFSYTPEQLILEDA